MEADMGIGLDCFEGHFRRREAGGWALHPWLPFSRRTAYLLPSDADKQEVQAGFGRWLQQYRLYFAYPWSVVWLGLVGWWMYETLYSMSFEASLLSSIMVCVWLILLIVVMFVWRYRVLKVLVVGFEPLDERFPVVESLRRTTYFRKGWISWAVLLWCGLMAAGPALYLSSPDWQRPAWAMAIPVFLFVLLGAVAGLMLWMMLLRRADRRAGRFPG